MNTATRHRLVRLEGNKLADLSDLAETIEAGRRRVLAMTPADRQSSLANRCAALGAQVAVLKAAGQEVPDLLTRMLDGLHRVRAAHLPRSTTREAHP